MSKITVNHGSDRIVRQPGLESGRPAADFGRGFYCTEDAELAGEWACRSGKSGFVNRYEWEDDGARILDLRMNAENYMEWLDDYEDGAAEAAAPDPEENLLKWLALVAENRVMPSFSAEFGERLRWLRENYLPDVSEYDVIIGYRADDVWFSLVRGFLGDEVSIETLKKSLDEKHGPVQIVFRSPEALDTLTFIGTQIADDVFYYAHRKQRDREVRELLAAGLYRMKYPIPIEKLPGVLESSYMKDSMRVLGEAVDYAVNDCGIPIAPFLEMLVATETGECFRKRDPRVISGLSGVELVGEIFSKSGMGAGGPEPSIKTKASPEYRIGRALACYIVGMGCGLRELLRLVNADDLLKLSAKIPEGEEGEWITGIERIVRRRSRVSRLQTQRKISGLSQRKLAELSGVNLRTLQQYEIKTKDLSKASVSSVAALAEVLGCRVEDLLELAE
ncbi:MAG: DUF3990 domain-containing protein [Firmicutes bacterium]|nr:DUF3990 domain-containing protein [Bacillota bacterium]